MHLCHGLSCHKVTHKCSWILLRVNLLSDDQRISWSCTITCSYKNVFPEGGRGVCERHMWEKLTYHGGFDLHNETGGKKNHIKGNVPLQTTAAEKCIGFCVCCWCYNSLIHVCRCQSLWAMNCKEVFFLPYPHAGQITDTPLKESKTAPTTSKLCCIFLLWDHNSTTNVLPICSSPLFCFLRNLAFRHICLFFFFFPSVTWEGCLPKVCFSTDLMAFFINNHTY